LIRFIFDKMEAPRGALRHYNADELEPLSRACLEALLMEIQDEYHLREGEDQLYVDATKPIRALLRKRRRESVGLSPPATQVIEAVNARPLCGQRCVLPHYPRGRFSWR
jgi:hypothetical protein